MELFLVKVRLTCTKPCCLPFLLSMGTCCLSEP